MTVTGPDVSHWQVVIDWNAVRGAGHSFAWCKATEGTTFIDNQFRNNWLGMQAVSLLRGAYHFLRQGNARDQAYHFVRTVGSFEGSLAAIDVEKTDTPLSIPHVEDVREFADTFHRLTNGHPLFVYTGNWYWGGYLGNPLGADIGPLWSSIYRPQHGPLYGGWNNYTIWQYTNNAACPGITGRCDMNISSVSIEELTNFAYSNGDDFTVDKATLFQWLDDYYNERWTVRGEISAADSMKSLMTRAMHIYNLVDDIPNLANQIAEQIPHLEVTGPVVEQALRNVLLEGAIPDETESSGN